MILDEIATLESVKNKKIILNRNYLINVDYISQHLIRRYLSYSLPSFDIMLDDFDAVDFDMVTSIHDMKDAMSNNLPT